jgi:CBS domain containing-hemolysin-like protein
MSLLIAVLLLLGNAFFNAAQFAFITTRRDQVEPLAEAGERGARSALTQLGSLPRMLAGTQLGIAICSLGLGAVAEPAFAHLLESGAERLHLGSGVVTGIAFVLALALVSFCHMVLGEMVPKNLALAGPVRAALLLAPAITLWVRVTRPVLVVISGVANGVMRLFGLRPKDELGGTYTADELAALFDESFSEGLLDEDERDRLLAAARLERTTAADLVIRMDDIVGIDSRATVRDLERLAAQHGFVRFPVRDGDHLIGYVNAKDALGVEDSTRRVVPDMVRPLPTVQASDPVVVLLRRAPHGDLALVQVCDGNELVGVLTLDDMLRAVAGVRPTTA